jgi:hypothetical protein
MGWVPFKSNGNTYVCVRRRNKGKGMNISGFIVFDKATGERLATLPLTIPIGSTIEGYEKAGHEVGWTWTESE